MNKLLTALALTFALTQAAHGAINTKKTCDDQTNVFSYYGGDADGTIRLCSIGNNRYRFTMDDGETKRGVDLDKKEVYIFRDNKSGTSIFLTVGPVKFVIERPSKGSPKLVIYSIDMKTHDEKHESTGYMEWSGIIDDTHKFVKLED